MRKKTLILEGDINDNLLLQNSKLSRIISTVVAQVSLLIGTSKEEEEEEWNSLITDMSN